jgi:hypothetical protein
MALAISTHCNPIRISLAAKDKMYITVMVKNSSEKPQLVSVDFEIPSELGFDTMGVANKKNARLGEISPGESKQTEFEVFATHRAQERDYTARITAFSHYRDYNNVLEKTVLATTIRVLE